MIERWPECWVVWHGHIPWAFAGTLCKAYEYQQIVRAGAERAKGQGI